MNKIFLKLNGTTSVPKVSGSTRLVTAKGFLGKDGSTGYFKPDELLDYARSLREPEIEQADQTFQCVNAGLRTTGSFVTRVDKGGRQYTYLTFNKINASVGLKVILEGGMKQFINDYQDGKISIDFTLEQLVEEAMND
jgi:hypothetical protein